jgi:peptidoglycan/xylan/chitin deacetylase (PgdA/CDA1 family)
MGQHVKRAFYQTRLQALLRRLQPSRYPVILRYHSISKNNELVSKGITVSPEAFEEQIQYFSKHFNTISMSTLVDCIQDRRPFPANALVLTFDDGYADNYKAAQILYKYHLTGLFYITAGCIESTEKFWVAELRHLLEKTERCRICIPVQDSMRAFSLSSPLEREEAIRQVTRLIKSVNIQTRETIRQELWKQLDDVPEFPRNLMLTWHKLKDMVAMEMEIGGHTMTHCNLPNANPEEAWLEISTCKSILEKHLGVEVKHFAYPNGGSVQHYNDNVKKLVYQAGFFSASTSKSGLVSFGSDLMELWRIRATENLFEILWEIEGAFIKKEGLI